MAMLRIARFGVDMIFYGCLVGCLIGGLGG